MPWSIFSTEVELTHGPFNKKKSKDMESPFAYIYDHIFPGFLLPGGSINVIDVSLHFGNLQLTNKTKQMI